MLKAVFKWESGQGGEERMSLCFILYKIKNTAPHSPKRRMRESREGQIDKLSQKTNFGHSEIHEIPNSSLNFFL